MIVQTFPSGPFETNAYIIACSKTNNAAIIDPAPDSADSIIQFLEKHQLHPKITLITHSHWDHIGDAAKIKEKFHTSIFIHQLDSQNLQKPGSDGLPLWVEIEGVIPDKFLNEGDCIEIGKSKWEVIHTPGHSPGGVCFLCKEHNILMSGDTLFQGSIGNLSFPTASPKDMWNSLAKLAKLPPETTVYPGHGPSTTIGKESWLSRAQEIFGDS